MIQDLKDALSKALAAQAFAALVAIPGFGFFFNLPVVRNVTQFLIERITRWAIQETSVGLSLLWIQLDMQYEVATAEDARKRLVEMLENPSSYSDAEQKKISENFDDTTVDLIQLAIRRLA